jgi:Fe2+ transport system protein B
VISSKDTIKEAIKKAKTKKVYIEGNFVKLLAKTSDPEVKDYIEECKKKDLSQRRKRLDITKQVQAQNKDLELAAKENDRVNKQLSKALDEASKSAEEAILAEKEAHKLRSEAEEAKEIAQTDLSLLQKKTQTELMSNIVKVALWVIMGVGLITTGLYVFVLLFGHDSKIIESTWSNLFGILLTNSFSIIGTIMGVKHATNTDKK